MDEIFFPVCGLLLLIIAYIPDLLGVGRPGIGRVQLMISGFGLILCAVPFVLKVRPWSWMKVRVERRKIGKKELLLVGLSLLVTLIVFDLALNLVLPPSYEATEFGWSLEPNREIHRTVEDTPGNFRSVTNRYFENGFKRWGTSNDERKTALIIGDSMTEMFWVSNGEEWYSHLENEFADTNFFVFGGAGYGSLQEFLILDKYYDEIEPDYVLWQFCSNDPHNNLYDLDIQSYPFNNHMVRPYLEGDEIVFRLPLPFSSVRSLSFVADRLLVIYDRNKWEEATQDIDAFLDKREREKERWSNWKKHKYEKLHSEAMDVTAQIMGKVRERVSKIPVYLFNLCRRLSEIDKRICEEQNFECIDGIYAHASALEEEGNYLRVVNDRHFNKEGNQVIGEWLVQYFKRQGTF